MAEISVEHESFEATQVEVESEEEFENSNDETKNESWGRLMSHHEGSIDLMKELYQFGRNPETSDILVEDKRVSAQHARIFREGNRFVNQSQNRSFIMRERGKDKDLLKLKQGESISLQHRDQISLLKPGKFREEVSSRVTWTFMTDEIYQRCARKSRAHGTESAQSVGTGKNVEDHYEVLFGEEVGRGQFGTVYRAVNRTSKQVRACKVVDVKRLELSGGQFDDTELTITQNLSHEGVLSVIDVFRDEKYIYIVLPLMRGGDLFERIASKHPHGYPESAGRCLFRKLVEAVKYLHDRDIIHRDIKPENLLLESPEDDASIRISDFGTSKRAQNCKTYCGTPQYFAPEVLQRQFTVKGEGCYGKPSDMWSLGVVLYVLLSGTPAFADKTLEDSVSSGSYRPLTGKRWENISDVAKDLVQKLLVVDPVKRLKAEEVLQHPWFHNQLKIISTSTGSDEGNKKVKVKRLKTE